MRITIVSDADLVNTNYRAYQPMQVFSRRGHEVLHNTLDGPRFHLASLLASDVVHIHRYLDDEIYAAAKQIMRAGVAVVWDNDDDLTSVPKENPGYRNYSGSKRRGLTMAIARIVRLVDVVTTPSPVLAEQFRGLGGHDVRLLENYLPRQFDGTRPRSHDGIVVGWIAGLEHQLDYQALRLRETFQRLLGAHPELRFESVGLGLGLPPDRYDHVRESLFLELAERAAGYDIGIAPLADIPWNRARSNVKLKEYAVAGTPWLASAVSPYLGLGEDEGGRLVPDDGWYDALDRLIVNAKERKKLGKRAAKWGKRQGIERNIGAWESVFRDALAKAAARKARPGAAAGTTARA